MLWSLPSQAVVDVAEAAHLLPRRDRRDVAKIVQESARFRRAQAPLKEVNKVEDVTVCHALRFRGDVHDWIHEALNGTRGSRGRDVSLQRAVGFSGGSVVAMSP